MTSRTPRDTARLRPVPGRRVRAARALQADGASAHRRSARRAAAARPPEGIPEQAVLARMARAHLAEAVRLARWADQICRDGGFSPSDTSAGASRNTRALSSGVPPTSETREAARAALGLTSRQLDTAWEHARLSGLLELSEGEVRPGWRLRVWDKDDAAVLRGWVALFDAWSLAVPPPENTDTALAVEVVGSAPQLLSLLHLTSGPLTVGGLLDLLAQRIAELRESRGETSLEGTAERLPALLAWFLDALVSVGALECRGDGTGVPAHTAPVALTALGNWAVWTKIEQICVAAQSVAGHIEQPAEELLRACARYSPGPARAEYRAWIAARPVGQAVAELLEVADGDDPLLRGLAFEALRVVGSPASAAVSSAAEKPALRPYALLWLAEQDGREPDDLLSRQEATWLWVDTAAAVADHGEGHLLVRHLESAAQGSVPRLLEELREVDHPRTVQVLVALAAAHPDPVLAKVVRRAAFQVHSGGVRTRAKPR